MSHLKTIVLTLIFATALSCVPSNAEAGPLLDWIRGLRRPRTNCNSGCNTGCNTPTPRAFAARPVTQAQANPANLQPGQCMRTCNQVCSRTVVNYVPQTAYRTNWERVPVTRYRPVTNSDPCTGCTVTCMRPCTEYTWKMNQQPYTTYRPVYRQEQYTVPVTTITNDCATGSCGTCSTCPTGTCGIAQGGFQGGNVVGTQSIAGAVTPTPVAPQVQNGTAANPNGTYFSFPQGQTLSTDATFGTTAPAAETTPSLNVSPQSFQRPLLDRFPSSAYYQPTTTAPTSTISNQSNIRPLEDDASYSAPAYINYEDKTAQSPARERWSYSPVRLASYNTEARNDGPVEIRNGYVTPVQQPVKETRPAPRKNAGWETVEY